MTTFDKREQAFEAQLAHDEEQKFKANARRDKLFGLWAAEKLGKTGAEAEAYANSLVEAVIVGGADAGVKRVRADFEKAGIGQSDHQINRKLDELLAEAMAAVKSGAGAVKQ